VADLLITVDESIVFHKADCFCFFRFDFTDLDTGEKPHSFAGLILEVRHIVEKLILY